MLPNKKIYPSIPYDIRLLLPVLFLVGIGIVMVYSASSVIAHDKFHDSYFFLKKHALFALIGLLGMIVFRHFPLQWLHAMTYPMLGVTFVFLFLLEFTGLGYSAGGATRWLRIAGISFQPSEFARFALIVYLAYSLSKKKERIKEFSIGFLPHVMIFGTFTLLILFQPDFGSAMILGVVTWVMMFAGGVRIVHLGSSLLFFMPIVYLYLIGAEYRIQRILIFLNPWKHATEGGYQITHSLMAFGTGGITGAGVGNGLQKLFYLPEPHTDFIFAVIGEELGLIGVLIVIGLFLWIFLKGISISLKALDSFGSFLALGLITSIGLQTCVNMGVALALLPTKGLTLPFLSYGGTSLLMNMCFIGLLMNIDSGGTAETKREKS